MEYIATFFTHFGAIKFGRMLDGKGLTYHMMPVPRKISSSCGTCVRFQTENIEGMGEDEDLEGLYVIVKDVYEELIRRD